MRLNSRDTAIWEVRRKPDLRMVTVTPTTEFSFSRASVVAGSSRSTLLSLICCFKIRAEHLSQLSGQLTEQSSDLIRHRRRRFSHPRSLCGVAVRHPKKPRCQKCRSGISASRRRSFSEQSSGTFKRGLRVGVSRLLFASRARILRVDDSRAPNAGVLGYRFSPGTLRSRPALLPDCDTPCGRLPRI